MGLMLSQFIPHSLSQTVAEGDAIHMNLAIFCFSPFHPFFVFWQAKGSIFTTISFLPNSHLEPKWSDVSVF